MSVRRSMTKSRSAREIPPGFIEIPTTHFVKVNGPIYGRIEDGKFVLGVRIEARHCNPRQVAHGGMLMTLADMTLSLASNYQAKLNRFLPTVKLEGDFLAAAGIGDWVEGRAEVLRVTRNLVFSQGLLSVGPTPILRASAVMKLPSKPGQRFDLLKLFA